MRRVIIEKAMKCIDEVYPGDNLINVQNFPLDDFIDEAARRIVRSAPLYALGAGVALMPGRSVTPRPDGSGTVQLPANFLRMIIFRMEGWKRPAIIVRSDHPLYRKQSNPITRGGTEKPVAVIVKGDTELEYYSVPEGTKHRVDEARYYGFSTVGGGYPHRLIDATAWQLAALVLSSMNDMQQAGTAQARADELIGQLTIDN